MSISLRTALSDGPCLMAKLGLIWGGWGWGVEVTPSRSGEGGKESRRGGAPLPSARFQVRNQTPSGRILALTFCWAA